jgi:hypothetical protein
MSSRTRLAVLFVLCFLISNTAADPPAPMTYQEMKAEISKAFKNKYRPLAESYFFIYPNYVAYNLDVYRPPCERDMSREAFFFHFPIRTQHIVESIRAYVTRNELGFWNPHLRKMEALIAQEVRLINGEYDPNDGITKDQLLKKLHELNRKITNGLETAISRRFNRIAIPKEKKKMNYTAYKVRFLLDPPNGRLFYLSALEHRLLARVGDVKDYTKWHDGIAGEAKLFGEFVFHARWESLNKEADYLRVPITDETVLRFCAP